MMRRHLLPYGFFLLLAILLTWPLTLNLNGGFIGAPESDAYEYARHMWWQAEALRTGEPMFAHPLLAYPDGLPGRWLWAIPFQSFPAWTLSLGMPLPVAYNLQALLWLSLNGWGMFVLARQVLAEREGAVPAALVAGTVFATYPTIQGHLFASHLGIIALWPVPLYVAGLLDLLENPLSVNGEGASDEISLPLFTGEGLGMGVKTAIFFVLSLLGSTMTLIYVLAPLTLTVFGMALSRRDWRGLLRVTGAVALGGLLATGFVVPALVEQLTDPSAVRPAGVIRFSADLLAVVSPSFFAPHAPPWSSRVIGTNIVEGFGYVGLVAGLLAIVGLWRERAARPWGWVALGAWVLSLGPVLKVFDAPLGITVDGRATFVPLPFALLAELPVLDITRTPGRFNLAVGFAVALLAGYGVAWLWQSNLTPKSPLREQSGDRPRGFLPFSVDGEGAGGWGSFLRYIPIMILIVLIAADYQIIWRGFPTVPAAIPEEIAALRDDDSVRAVLNLPHDNLLVAKEAMYLQTAHSKPIIGGFVSRETPVSYAKRQLLQATLDPALLDTSQVDVVIVFREAAPDLDDQARSLLGAPFYADDRLAAFRVPQTDEPPLFLADTWDNATQVYTPSDGWYTWQLTSPDENRELVLTLNGEPLRPLAFNDTDTLAVAVPVPVGYHTVAVELAEPCPRYSPSPALTCAPPALTDALMEPIAPFGLSDAVRFGEAITLRDAAVTAGENGVQVHLWWDFAAPPDENAVRFVQLVGADGTQIAGDDTPLTVNAGDYVETVAFDLPNPPDAASVYVGWYTFPSLSRLPVQGAIPGAASNWAQVGTVGAPP